MEGGGCLLPEYICTNTGIPVIEFLWEKHPNMGIQPVEYPMSAYFEGYEEVPETVPLEFSENDIVWVLSNLTGATGDLGAEAIELCNCLIRFGCISEELKVIITKLSNWVDISSPTWAAYCSLMYC